MIEKRRKVTKKINLGRKGTITQVPKFLLAFICLTTLIGLFIKLSVLTFQPKIVIYRRGNFVYHHCGCTVHQFISNCLIHLEPGNKLQRI